jgi:thiol-disulfide isomerase/thioredoxin
MEMIKTSRNFKLNNGVQVEHTKSENTMRLLFLAIILIIFSDSYGQSGYKLDFKIHTWSDTTTYLGTYYNESTVIVDTAKVDSKGEFRFDGKKTLGQGMYYLVLGKAKMPFEFLVGSNQHFKLETKSKDYVKGMKVTGDLDNTLFFENMLFNAERHKEVEPFLTKLKDSTLTEEQKKPARAAFNKVNEAVAVYQKNIISKYPNTLMAAILRSYQPINIPEAPKRPDGTIDSTYQLRWYRLHFFDNFDLGNEAFIRMSRPVYTEKINEYLDKLFAPHPDTLMNAIDKLVLKTKGNKEAFKFLTWNLLTKYQQPEIMGLDAVYVGIYDKYFATGEASYWMNDKLKKNVQEFADRLRKSLIGKTGANLIMQDANLKARSMYDIKNKYTILFIFDPDCGHCRQETPKLAEFYARNKAKFDVEVFAVSTDTSLSKMDKFVKEMKTTWITVNGPRTYVGPYQDFYDAATTPSLFILDDKKKIIAKKIPAEKLEEFFTNYERFHPRSQIH